jgi:excinuclease UvrABC nuclease subunit
MWCVPYIGKKSTQRVYGKSGVYLIRDILSKEVIYVGMSKSNLWKALYRHFQSWDDPLQNRVVYTDRFGYEVKTVILDIDVVYDCERALIKKLTPRDNRIMYVGYECEVDVELIFGDIRNEIPF